MKKIDYTNTKTILFLATLSTFLWGCAPSFIKTGYKLLELDSSDTFSIILFAGIRFMLAGIIVILIESIRNKSFCYMEPASFKNICILALFQTFGQYFIYYLGVMRTSGVNASILTGTGALISLCIAVFIFKSEKMTRNKLFGCLCGLLGIVIMNLSGKVIQFSLVGDGLILGSQICYALSASFMNRFGKNTNAIKLSGYQFFFGGLALITIAYIFGGRLYFTGYKIFFVILYLAIISAVAYTVWGLLLAHNPVSKIGIYGCLTPLFGVLISAMLLNEWSQAISLTSILALACIIMALGIVNKEKMNI